MTDLRKAAEMALEALEELPFANAPFLDEAMEALRQALVQPEHEPVAWMHILSDGRKYCVTKDESGFVDDFINTYTTIPLYTAPPKRELVGLTDGELPEGATYEFDRGVRWAEAKLKEKNT